MRTFHQHKLLTTLLACLLFTACGGKASPTAAVTLVSGLENQSRHFNLMAALHDHAQDFAAGDTGCKQNQILSGFGIKAADDSSNAIATYAVNLTTPYSSGMAVNDYSGGAAGWLVASTLDKITLPAPTNVLLDFGILGALNYGQSASDGTCAAESGGSLIPSYSLIGHTSATITTDTTLPIRLWVNKAAANAADLPTAPIATNACSSTTHSDALTQLCPTLNFDQILISCPSGSSCAGTDYKLKLEYFYSINGSQHITQLVNLTDATGNTASKLLIPDIQPLTLTILDLNDNVIESVQLTKNNSGSSPSPTPYFVTAAGVADTAYVSSISNSGFAPTPTPTSTSTPSPFALITLTQDPNTANLSLVWSNSPNATGYDVEISSDDSTFTAIPSLTNLPQALVSATLSPGTLPSGYAAGSVNYLRVRAKNAAATTVSASVLSIIPVGKSSSTPSLGAGTTGQINVIWSAMMTGAGTYAVHYGATSGVGTYPSGYSAGTAINPGTSLTVSGLTSAINYSFVIEGKNSSGGSVISAVGTLTAP